ncbi:hypothetical protein [Vreelandella subglaciescola]|jgi:hypothetical protein|uniref:YceI-like domain-containing protein n=1 Tax=Vreelandella subglaciescola TaxID=29571 RepID=A0A1M7FY18_9GAMM|nr:hypothetical protein [Halomonas subglaciescola]SHM08951.1 hypothetical protein SAMN05878437_1162 [Halomonas subglaciescola]
MLKKTCHLACALGVACLSLALPAQASWTLIPSESHMGVTITELTASGETAHQHQLSGLSGRVADDGTLRLPLRLNQLDTLERFETLQPWLAGLADTTLATLTTTVDTQRLAALPVGSTLVDTLVFHAKGQQAPIKLRFIRLDEATIRVTQAEPLTLDSQEVRADSVGRSVLALLGYGEIKRDIPVTFEAFLQREE